MKKFMVVDCDDRPTFLAALKRQLRGGRMTPGSYLVTITKIPKGKKVVVKNQAVKK